ILGWETLRSSASAAVAHAAQEGGIPAIALCGRVEAGRRETMAAGYSGTYAVASSLATWPAFAADPARALAVRAESVARTWSPPTPA
ncbi:MAG TPA: glycerate kinase, partial [Dermatophilaceae bacterium]|nr:glycerate kinase [Dermatophilaceae bacterium]